jgi:glutamine synthetase
LGVSDSGSSIRVPLSTAKEWKGYVEDRRPASNGDPYKIVKVIADALDFALHLDKINYNMTAKVDVEKAREALAYLGDMIMKKKKEQSITSEESNGKTLF